jgi:formylmethanofuran dehydrogenase subunit E
MRMAPEHDAEIREPHLNCYGCRERVPESSVKWLDDKGFCQECFDNILAFVKRFILNKQGSV